MALSVANRVLATQGLLASRGSSPKRLVFSPELAPRPETPLVSGQTERTDVSHDRPQLIGEGALSRRGLHPEPARPGIPGRALRRVAYWAGLVGGSTPRAAHHHAALIY